MNGVEELLDLLTEQGENITTGEHILEENEQLDTAPYKIRGCFLTSVENLDAEFVKVLKNCDAHCNEYMVFELLSYGFQTKSEIRSCN